MYPGLELNWRATHASLVVYAPDQLQGRLPGDLIANVEKDVAIGFTGKRGELRPDVHITEKWDSGGDGGGVAVAPSPVAAKGIQVVLAAGVNVVEVDLLRAGDFALLRALRHEAPSLRAPAASAARGSRRRVDRRAPARGRRGVTEQWRHSLRTKTSLPPSPPRSRDADTTSM
jgi:hypothetical protein